MGKKKIFTSDAWADFIVGITALKDTINNKADADHTHDYAANSHNHDDRYYIKSEIDNYELITIADIDEICGSIPDVNLPQSDIDELIAQL